MRLGSVLSDAYSFSIYNLEYSVDSQEGEGVLFPSYYNDYLTTCSLIEMSERKQIWVRRESTNEKSEENLCINAVKAEFCRALIFVYNTQGTRL